MKLARLAHLVCRFLCALLIHLQARGLKGVKRYRSDRSLDKTMALSCLNEALHILISGSRRDLSDDGASVLPK